MDGCACQREPTGALVRWLPEPKGNLSMLPKICVCFVVCIAFAVTIALAVVGPRMVPALTGNAEDFWRLAAGVDLANNASSRSGHAFLPDDGWVAYSLSHLHGSDLFCVREEVALSSFETVKSLLQQAADRGDDSPFVHSFKEWQSRDAAYQTPARLLHAKGCSRKNGVELALVR